MKKPEEYLVCFPCLWFYGRRAVNPPLVYALEASTADLCLYLDTKIHHLYSSYLSLHNIHQEKMYAANKKGQDNLSYTIERRFLSMFHLSRL